MLKLWSEIKSSTSYQIVVDESVFDGVDKGNYTSSPKYVGSGEHEGYFILLTSFGKYIISDKIGDDLNFFSNIPQLSDRSGVYSIDMTKRPNGVSTIYKFGSFYCGTNFEQFGVYSFFALNSYGRYLISRLEPANIPANDRDGNLLSYYLKVTSLNISSTTTIFTKWKARANTNTNLLLLKSESDSGLSQNELEATAKIAFDAKDYHWIFSPANNWSGWVSDTIAGVYEGFGSNSSTVEVGHLKYSDDNGKIYYKGFDIVERENNWYMTYKENGEEYKSSSEPQTSDVTFSNSKADPQSVDLTFVDYAERSQPLNLFDVGVDLR